MPGTLLVENKPEEAQTSTIDTSSLNVPLIDLMYYFRLRTIVGTSVHQYSDYLRRESNRDSKLVFQSGPQPSAYAKQQSRDIVHRAIHSLHGRDGNLEKLDESIS
ncbi:hypothetical protein FRC14_005774 [Serendipita sp. 396]|nr:hypothetical protein FRC14_005774 [Serendipita sp. 396]KAG8783237.1 hypothetical protein FRC15_005573 [Serendipita sp. 397]KAG8799055.1 hypothetical protein FRC16_005908 [Serendipita sp. 398]KAG8826217.1 hypothetical protein FRC18_010112 [Serendipita sp. 400]KAG8867321.1 hypothetical protein FRC20_006086 [Serendipita sp. 405]KAG9024052.1 hypothetical protein FS842_005573 [Serendipita sp. 407]